MADFSITIGDSIDILGGEPPNLWGALVWGTDGWAVGQPEIQYITHLLDGDAVSLASAVSEKRADNTFSDSISMATMLTLLTLRDAAGFLHVFQGNTTDSEERGTTTWSSASNSSASWSQVSSPSTVWSEV
jgi:hypothetical protein